MTITRSKSRTTTTSLTCDNTLLDINCDNQEILIDSTDMSTLQEMQHSAASVVKGPINSSSSPPVIVAAEPKSPHIQADDTSSNAAILNRISALEETITKLNTQRDEMKSHYNRLQRKVYALEDYNDVIDNSLTALEKELSLLAQYGRRESIEILGIPSSVKIHDLEDKAIEILRNIGVVVDPKEIVAVHRLKDYKNGKPPSTIVRFVNRKHAFESLKNKKKLNICEEKMGLKHLYIIENLCPVYKSLFEKCRKLKKDNKIKHLWSYNGVINIRYTDSRNENPIKLYHEEDFNYYFSHEENDNWEDEEV